MATIDEDENLSILKKISNKIQDGTEATISSGKKFAGTINDSLRSTFADSPLIGSMVDLGESVGKDVLGIFSSDKKDDKKESDKITQDKEAKAKAFQQRQENKEELKQVTLELENLINNTQDLGVLERTDNEQIIDHLKDIKEVWDAGDNAEKEREDNRREDKKLELQEKQNKLLEELKRTKKEDDTDFSFFDKIKKHIVLTVASIITFISSPIIKLKAFLKPLVGMFGKFIKVLGPIGILIATLIGAFTGFNKATEIFGENATIFEKVASSLAGILSGLTFGFIDIEPLALGIKSAMDFISNIFSPFITSAGTFFSSIGILLSNSFGLLTSLFTGTPDEIDAAYDKFIGSFTGLGDKFLDMVTDLVKGLWTHIMLIPKLLIKQLGNFGKFIGSNIADFFSEKTEGEKLYQRLEDEGGLDDKFIGSDTMSKADIAKLSIQENTLLQKYLIENDKASAKSEIIANLQNELNKTKQEQQRKESQITSNAIIDASSVSNTVNNSYVKASARTPDIGMKTASIQT